MSVTNVDDEDINCALCNVIFVLNFFNYFYLFFISDIEIIIFPDITQNTMILHNPQLDIEDFPYLRMNMNAKQDISISIYFDIP